MNNNDSAASSVESWSQFWKSGELFSCQPASDEDRTELFDFWSRLAQLLPDGADVVDLCTGNGAIPAYLLKANNTLNIVGVDKAEVNPNIASFPELHQVEFISGQNVNDYTAQTPVDAVTSQFGIEYSNLLDVAKVVGRLLKRQGRFVFLVHHQFSDVVKPRRRDLDEIMALLAPRGVIAMVQSYFEGEVDFNTLEKAGQQHLSRGELNSNRISGQVFQAIDAMVSSHNQRADKAKQHYQEVLTRLRSEQERLQQLFDAAKSEIEINQFKTALQAQGLTVEQCKPMHVGAARGSSGLIGWHVCGYKQ